MEVGIGNDVVPLERHSGALAACLVSRHKQVNTLHRTQDTRPLRHHNNSLEASPRNYTKAQEELEKDVGRQQQQPACESMGREDSSLAPSTSADDVRPF